MIPAEELMRWGDMGNVSNRVDTSDWERMRVSSGSSSLSLGVELDATEIFVVVVGVVGAVMGLLVVGVGGGLVCVRACRMAARLVGSVFASRLVRAVGSLPKRVVNRAVRSGRGGGGGSGIVGSVGCCGDFLRCGVVDATWRRINSVGVDGADGGVGVGVGG